MLAVRVCVPVFVRVFCARDKRGGEGTFGGGGGAGTFGVGGDKTESSTRLISGLAPCRTEARHTHTRPGRSQRGTPSTQTRSRHYRAGGG